jgi:hypothetical protein
VKKFLAQLCSLFLVLFIADAGMSVLDDALTFSAGVTILAPLRGLIGVLVMLGAMLLYGLMALTPIVPKRWIIPLILFLPAVMLAGVPFSIYFFNHAQIFVCAASLLELALGLWILRSVVGRLGWRWPLVREDQLGTRAFSLGNTIGFVLANVCVLFPAILLYLAVCASLAADHFTDGFMALRPSGLILRAKSYTRADGKTVELMPMMHMGDAGFYNRVTKSFPPGAIVLLEGVTDTKQLLQHHLSYQHVATTLGLTAQKEQFSPSSEHARRADVDVEEFSPPTIDFLNLTAQLYSGNITPQLIVELMQKSADPRFAQQLWDDILAKRNAHLTQEIRDELQHSDTIAVPWGAMHMPAMAAEMAKDGFVLSKTEEFPVVSFTALWEHLSANQPATPSPAPGGSITQP